MFVTVAAVDVGILGVTGFTPPSATQRFLSQTRLGVEIRDVYGRLIDGMSADRGALRSGGDADTSLKLEAAPPMWKTVAKFSGIVPVNEDGRAQVTFDIPEFAGTIRLMAVAWSDTKIGEAVRDVIVRDPVTLTVSTPRFLSLGDQAQLTFDVHNVEAGAGDFEIALSAISTDGPARALTQQTVSMDALQRKRFSVPFTAERLGNTTIIARVRKATAPGNADLIVKRELSVRVVAPGREVKRTTTRTLKAGASTTIGAEQLDGLIQETAKLAISVGAAAAFDVPGLLAALDRYPYGCTEQTISRSLPLLYANALGQSAGLARDANLAPRLEAAIERVLGRQDSSGAFGVWSPAQTDLWLTAYTTDFLTRAREEGHKVPDRALRSALERLANFVRYTQSVERSGADLAYALYVLARNGQVPAGELRYYTETKLSAFVSPIAKAQLGAALIMIGDRDRARAVFTAALEAIVKPQPNALTQPARVDFGSQLRDAAGVLALASEAGLHDLTARLVPIVEQRISARRLLSTQEQAWLLLAARALAKRDDAATLTVARTSIKGAYAGGFTATALTERPLKITNTSAVETRVTLTAIGPSLGLEPPVSDGFNVSRTYYTLDGKPVDLAGADGSPAKISQNTKLVVVLKVTAHHRGGRTLLVDRLPAGLEVENPKLVESGSIATLDWLNLGTRPVHTEFRDDRFVAAYNLFNAATTKLGDGKVGHTLTAAYIVRAVTAGRFAHPPATIEDMYRPQRHARTAASELIVVRKD